MTETRDRLIAALLFIGSFAVYLFTCGPWVVPYRDTGEMAVLLKTLGVAHPPGYPLYTLVGHFVTLFPVGTPAYQANVGSAIFAAAAICLLYLTLRVWMKPSASLAGAILFALSNPFWELASVSEMYTLGIFWTLLIFFCVFRLQNIFAASLCMGLGLGARMDLLLLVGVLVLWIYWTRRPKAKEIFAAAGAFTLGFLIFLYLPIRSRTQPLLDWANPETFDAFFNAISRKSYSGTLDLLSLSYRRGENFGVNLALYTKHWTQSFGWPAVLACIGGFFVIFRRQKQLAWLWTILFAISGPVFLFLANMPPNPHAIAVVEAAYPLIDLLLIMITAWSFAWLADRYSWAPMAALTVCLFVSVPFGFRRANKRNNLYLRDYVTNVFRSAPQSAIVVFHKDVQVFGLWYAQAIEHWRPDVSIVATGLSASEWYWTMLKRWNVSLAPAVSLKSTEGWLELKAQAGLRPVLCGFDTDVPTETHLGREPHGEMFSLTSQSSPGSSNLALLDGFNIHRNWARYSETPDFFSTDLIGDTARAYQETGFELMIARQYDAAQYFLRRSQSIDPTSPRPDSDLGFVFFSLGKFELALANYLSSAQKNEEMLKDAHDYKALPDVVQLLRADLANDFVSAGGVLERLGRKEEARTVYQRSLSSFPTARAHYNLAVTFWNADWNEVISHLRAAVSLDPNMAEAKQYLQVAYQKSGMAARPQ